VAGLFANILINKTEDGDGNEDSKVNDDAVEEEEEEEVEYLATAQEINALRTFSPLIVHRQIHASNPKERIQPSCRTHFGAILFADISGFTRLANLLSVEQLQFHISTYFKMLFDCVERFGGDILKLCGDAIMIMWPCEQDSSQASLVEKQAVALTACLCGRELLLSCGLYTAFYGDVEIRLSLHCGVGVADVPCYWVGKSGRWEFLITGDALRQIASTEPEASSGEIVISPETYELVQNYLATRLTPLGNHLMTSEIKYYEGPLVTAERDIVAESMNFERFDRAPVSNLSDQPTLQFNLYRAIASKYLKSFARADPQSLDYMAANKKMGTGLEYYGTTLRGPDFGSWAKISKWRS
jgi:class 3 adenylate cyclase